jgi:hypothetical protein
MGKCEKVMPTESLPSLHDKLREAGWRARHAFSKDLQQAAKLMLRPFGHGGASDGAAGRVRSVASRTGDILHATARVASFLHPGLDLDDRVARLLVRLELGISAGAIALARYVGARLTRGEYQRLLKEGL